MFTKFPVVIDGHTAPLQTNLAESDAAGEHATQIGSTIPQACERQSDVVCALTCDNTLVPGAGPEMLCLGATISSASPDTLTRQPLRLLGGAVFRDAAVTAGCGRADAGVGSGRGVGDRATERNFVLRANLCNATMSTSCWVLSERWPGASPPASRVVMVFGQTTLLEKGAGFMVCVGARR